jgi:hypothetical protein
LNHIISLSNVFGVEATVNMLTFKVEQRNHHILNAFFLYLEYAEAKDLEVLDLDLYNYLKKII